MGPLSHVIQMVTDNPERSQRLRAMLGRWFHISTVPIDAIAEIDPGAMACVIDVNLSVRDNILKLRQFITPVFTSGFLCFVIDEKRAADAVQANALGAAQIIRSGHLQQDIAAFTNCVTARLMKNVWRDAPENTRRSLSSMTALNDDMYNCVSAGRPLPHDKIRNSTSKIIIDIDQHAKSLSHWLDIVKEHHSYTYRHCMTVSGLATAFAISLGMCKRDVERITVGALMHDIGKMRLPLAILDKPGPLSAEERALINKHPDFGAEILQRDGKFSDEVVDITLHHHELLDGSGYPDGLKGNEISDPVRIVTIIDIFSAMIDDRAYRMAIPSDEAYAELVRMGDKLDQDIVRAFEPTASSCAGDAHEGGMGHARTA